ncbi:MAG: nickel/cobalt transporter [Candidatus Thiodiazotropha sp. (ex Lucina aurantia)]|nr:nickel/cobalt transporter [Candidatus Thiodiazotropha taylori]MBV2097446.1 nickel/cobalt transporter [Candidatus Thiodiazotropha sp. (ex Codakia orbicularis)]MBV2102180.1 nickel/cobalt transporter [Candidatus Thiodiazotropha sp. (ex Lucina aurantia)]MBV2116840.1 nickel/cobalt transporter [Candidatus Thiodiazotropha sp. (ex Lucina aurantia)]
MFIVLAWMGAIAFSAESHATTLLPGERATTEQSRDGNHASTERAVGIWELAAAWVWAKQREFHRALTRELRELRGKEGVGWALVLMSFLYGVLHAAGPGHGKAVLTTYLLTHQSRLNRGIAMGTAAALLQGVTALVLVYGLVGLAGWLPRETETASLWAARVSFILLATVGLYLLVGAARTLFGTVRRLRYEAGHVHHDHDGHVHGESCGCRHLPTAVEIDTVGSRHATAGVVLAIGLRPCSGAVLVLILATVMDLMWHGAFAVIGMSVGTAITIVSLAILATKARDWASAVVAHRSPLWSLAAGGVGALGGALLLLLALWLLNTSFAMKPAMGL